MFLVRSTLSLILYITFKLNLLPRINDIKPEVTRLVTYKVDSEATEKLK